MYYDDLIVIKYEATEIAQSKRKGESFVLRSCTIDGLNKAIDKRVKSLKEKGMTLFRLEFICDEGNEEEEESTPAIRCCVKGSRMETEEETQERIMRQDKYNEKVHKQRAEGKEQSDRRKELKRLTEHLTLDQLKAIKSIQL